jgi:hypothetical protein
MAILILDKKGRYEKLGAHVCEAKLGIKQHQCTSASFPLQFSISHHTKDAPAFHHSIRKWYDLPNHDIITYPSLFVSSLSLKSIIHAYKEWSRDYQQ